MNSAIYLGAVRHRRYTPSEHRFSYPMYMLALDLDEIELVESQINVFSSKKFRPLRFNRNDYLGDFDLPLKQAVMNKIDELGGDSAAINKVIMLGQVRCFGLYFSPVNFFFCYQGNEAVYMLAEVRNTPWNERHCYLVDINEPKQTKKQFHVSPFMDLDMDYRWQIKPPQDFLKVHIENWKKELWFDATLRLKRQTLTNKNIKTVLFQWPLMTFIILKNIYLQAFKLYKKKVPFYSHS